MAVTTINYKISPNGISPFTVQFGGTQGDNKATELQVELDDKLVENIKEKVREVTVLGKECKAVYRFDGYDGEGNVVHGNPKALPESSAKLFFSLEEWITRYGGVITVYLVLTIIINDSTEMELYSFPMKLRLNNISAAPNEPSRESLSAIMESAKKAKEAAETAKEAVAEIERMRLALEGGSEWIFDGGLPDEEVDIRFLIDTALSDQSNNAISNAAVYKALKKIKDEIFLEMHPVGSYYWSSKATSPKDLFGGEWEQIEGRFLLAAGSKIKFEDGSVNDLIVNAKGGEYMHQLKKEEIPKHTHPLVTQYGRDFVAPATNGSGLSSIWHDGEPNGNPNGHWFSTYWWAGEQTYDADKFHNNLPPYIVAYCWRRTA